MFFVFAVLYEGIERNVLRFCEAKWRLWRQAKLAEVISSAREITSLLVRVTKRNKSELFRKSKLVRICFLLLMLKMGTHNYVFPSLLFGVSFDDWFFDRYSICFSISFICPSISERSSLFAFSNCNLRICNSWDKYSLVTVLLFRLISQNNRSIIWIPIIMPTVRLEISFTIYR